MGKTIQIGKDIYDIPHNQFQVVSKALTDMWIFLGKPQTPLSESGKKLMTVLIATWEDTYPKEAREWVAMREEYKAAEMSIQEQVKQGTGRSLASYPEYIFVVMKRLFPEFDPINRENCMALVKEFPMFRMANKV